MIDPCEILDDTSYVKTLSYGQWHIRAERPKILEDGIAMYHSDADSIFIPAGVRKIEGANSSFTVSYTNWNSSVMHNTYGRCMPREIYLDLEVFKTLDIEMVDILPWRLHRIVVIHGDKEGLVFDTHANTYIDTDTAIRSSIYLYILKYVLYFEIPEAKNVTSSLIFVSFIREIFDLPSIYFYLLVKWTLVLLFVDEERFVQLFSILASVYNKATGKTVAEEAIEVMIQTADFSFEKGIERICSLNLSREYFLYLLDFVTNLDDSEVKGSLKGETTTMIIKKLSSFEEDYDDGRFDL